MMENLEILTREQEIFSKTTFLENMALVYSKLAGEDNLRTTLAVYKEALQLLEKNLLGTHPHAAKFSNRIGNIYVRIGGEENLQLALLYYHRALEIINLIMADQSEYIIGVLGNIARAHIKLGGEQNLYTALNYYDQALKLISKQYLFGEGVGMIGFLHNSSILYSSLGGKDNLKEAIRCQEQILKIQNQDRTAADLVIAETMNNIANLCRRLGNSENLLKSIDYQKKALELRENLLPEPVEIISALHELATAYTELDSKEYTEQALHYHHRALEIERKIFPILHSSIANSLNNIANIFSYLGGDKNLKLALHYHHETLAIKTQIFTEGDPSIAESLKNIGIVYQKLGELDNSYKYLTKSYLLTRNFEHSELLVTFNQLRQEDTKLEQLLNWLDIELTQKKWQEISYQEFFSKVFPPIIVIDDNKALEIDDFWQITDDASHEQNFSPILE